MTNFQYCNSCTKIYFYAVPHAELEKFTGDNICCAPELHWSGSKVDRGNYTRLSPAACTVEVHRGNT
jgi:hypothetical protein